MVIRGVAGKGLPPDRFDRSRGEYVTGIVSRAALSIVTPCEQASKGRRTERRGGPVFGCLRCQNRPGPIEGLTDFGAWLRRACVVSALLALPARRLHCRRRDAGAYSGIAEITSSLEVPWRTPLIWPIMRTSCGPSRGCDAPHDRFVMQGGSLRIELIRCSYCFSLEWPRSHFLAGAESYLWLASPWRLRGVRRRNRRLPAPFFNRILCNTRRRRRFATNLPRCWRDYLSGRTSLSMVAGTNCWCGDRPTPTASRLNWSAPSTGLGMRHCR